MDSVPEASDVSLQVGEWTVRNDLLRIESASGHALLEPRPMQLLLYLAERPFRVIAPDQLLADIWGGTFYGDAPLQRAVAMLRRALGDCATAPRYIQTVRKRGYRLIAPVSRDALGEQPAAAGLARHRPDAPRAHSCQDASRASGRNRLLATARRALLQQAGAPHKVVLMLAAGAGGKSTLMYAGLIPLPQRRQEREGLRAAAVAQLGLEMPHAPGRPGETALRRVRERRADNRSLTQNTAAGCDQQTETATDATNRRPRLLLTLDHTEQLAVAQDQQILARFAQTLEALIHAPALTVIKPRRRELYRDLLWALPLLAD